MAHYPSKGESLWVQSTSRVDYAPLAADLEVDVAVIGGGIAGLSAAYMLKQRGKRVAVIEKHQIDAVVSGFTTGKVTSQHGLTYASLIEDFGKDQARLYGEANEAAIKHIKKILRLKKLIVTGSVRLITFSPKIQIELMI